MTKPELLKTTHSCASFLLHRTGFPEINQHRNGLARFKFAARQWYDRLGENAKWKGQYPSDFGVDLKQRISGQRELDGQRCLDKQLRSTRDAAAELPQSEFKVFDSVPIATIRHFKLRAETSHSTRSLTWTHHWKSQYSWHASFHARWTHGKPVCHLTRAQSTAVSAGHAPTFREEGR